ncbi:uncharacterized protein LOC125665276 [Ostrea edulis]|uniref:uncharacterized protein LOC125665276 n=1 Tax=Ostrea edulis TaxID=37623 RepID=UPI0024AF876F|nr:uncharacterized protein LOC125665276 [Ostrea edulis]
MVIFLLFSFILLPCLYSATHAIIDVKELTSLRETVRLQNQRIYYLEKMMEMLIQREKHDKSVLIDDNRNRVIHKNISESREQGTAGFQDTERTQRLQRDTKSYMRNTSPASVSFFAYMTYIEDDVSTHHTLIFDHAPLNVGGGYHQNSGIFIAPTTGVYVFMWSVRINKQSIVLIVNGSSYTSLYNRSVVLEHSDGADETVTGFAVAHVNQGDDVFLRTHSSYHGDGGIFSNEFGRSSFCGWLLR